MTKALMSQPVKLVAVSAAELFIETVATQIANAIIEEKLQLRKEGIAKTSNGKILRLIKKENDNVQLHNQSESTPQASG